MQELYTITQNYQRPIISPTMPEVKKAERRVRLNERNEKIRAEYMKGYARGFRTDKIISDLGVNYALDAYTLEAIVFRKGVYKEF